LIVKPARTAAAIKRRFSVATGSSPRTGLWVKAMACLLIASGAVPVVRLTEIFRQAATSCIITNAHRINQGFMPELVPADGGDFYFVNAADPEEGVRKLLAIVQERIPKRFGLDPIRDVQCSAR